MKLAVRVNAALLVLFSTVSSFAVNQTEAVTCYYKDANGSPVGRIQQNCAGGTAVTLHSGKSWDEATTYFCTSYPCTLGAICDIGLEWWKIDGACSCVSDTFILALTPRDQGGQCPNNPAGCPTLEESPSCSY